MISAYIHIPFCTNKCDYCNFFVVQQNHPNFQANLINEYVLTLHREIDHWSKTMEHQEIKTIYLGGGTPLSIGKDHIFGLIDHIIQVWNSESLEEISIELNPDPFDEVLDFIRSCNQRYAQMMRVRYSFGIQTFDDDILE